MFLAHHNGSTDRSFAEGAFNNRAQWRQKRQAQTFLALLLKDILSQLLTLQKPFVANMSELSRLKQVYSLSAFEAFHPDTCQSVEMIN